MTNTSGGYPGPGGRGTSRTIGIIVGVILLLLLLAWIFGLFEAGDVAEVEGDGVVVTEEAAEVDDAVENAAEETGEAVENAAEATGEAVEDAAAATEQAVEEEVAEEAAEDAAEDAEGAVD